MLLLRKLWVSSKKYLPLIIICLAIIASSRFILKRHYQNFVQQKFNEEDLVYKIEAKLLDMRFLLRGKKAPHPKVGILAIDEKTLGEAGYPVDRKYYEKAFANLKKLGVKWVGFDIIFSEKSKALLADILPDIKKMGVVRGNTRSLPVAEYEKQISHFNSLMENSPTDIALARGIKDFQNVTLGYFFFASQAEADMSLGKGEQFRGFDKLEPAEIVALDIPAGNELSNYNQIQKAYGLVSNIPMVADASQHSGFFSNNGDKDAIYRWVTLVANMNGHLMPSLALKTVAEYLNCDIIVEFGSGGINAIKLANREDPTKEYKIPIDPLGSGRVLLNHMGPSQSFHHYSLADAYNNTFTKEERKNLKDGVLLLGGTATGTNDLRANPFDPAIDGVEHHAAVIDSVIRQQFMRRPLNIFDTEINIAVVVGLLFAPLMIWGRALFSGLAVIAFLVGYYYVDKYLWFSKGVWAYMAVPSLEILVMFFVTIIYKYMTEEQEKKKVKGAFQHYLSPDVIDQVLKDPSSLQLGGVKKELTVFFSDVRGFTNISETLSPEKLCELMNDYFTPMTGLILRSGGVLDKYIGDAVMAFWGAPIEIEDAADRAAQASLEMLYAMDKLRGDFAQKGFPPIDIGIGLNTGLMAVGNMGSGERFCYTVMGDSVNLGARLEGLTKEYGIKIMISQFTQAKLKPGKFLTRDLDDIRVKGKNEPVKVFELMRPDFLKQTHLIPEFIQQFGAARMAYKTQKWEEGKKYFAACLAMKPDDKACVRFIEQIDDYEKNPPGESWDGVYTFKHK